MKIHFVGCEGTSMRFLYRLVKEMGNEVTGSDITTTGHNPTAVIGRDLVVYTGAVGFNNPELAEAKKLGIKTMERSVFLGEIAKSYKKVISVSGTHGKTTTTGMMWEILSFLNPSVHIGGEYLGENGHVGGSEWFITEACEYRRSFLELSSYIGIITNMELDHTDYYRDLDDVFSAFSEFSKRCASIVVYGDDPYLSSLAHKNKITFGLSESNDFIASDTLFCGKEASFAVMERDEFLGRFKICVTGQHNVLNALGAIAAARTAGISVEKIKNGIYNFKGVKRRFEFVGSVGGADVFSDYAHHPSEIKATISAAKKLGYKKIGVVFEPHTYTRLKSLCSGFKESLMLADEIVITKVYAAREDPIEGVTGEALYELIKKEVPAAFYEDDYSGIISLIKSGKTESDVWLILGAGTIRAVSEKLVEK